MRWLLHSELRYPINLLRLCDESRAVTADEGHCDQKQSAHENRPSPEMKTPSYQAADRNPLNIA
jgi:hypothetical protein